MANFITATQGQEQVSINTELICSIHSISKMVDGKDVVQKIVIYLAGNVKEEFTGEAAYKVESHLIQLYGPEGTLRQR